MTKQVDLDALIAGARDRGDALRALFPDDGDIRDDARLFETLADALESTLAELQQEREKRRPVALRDLMDAHAALSRAKETIEKVQGYADRKGTFGFSELHNILAEYETEQ